jgi:hypothetical protein
MRTRMVTLTFTHIRIRLLHQHQGRTRFLLFLRLGRQRRAQAAVTLPAVWLSCQFNRPNHAGCFIDCGTDCGSGGPGDEVSQLTVGFIPHFMTELFQR